MIETQTTTDKKTKICPFCAEVIMARALKCRFCGEIMNPDRIKAVERATDPNDETDGNILYTGRPSLWAMTGACIKAAIVLCLAWLLFKYPIENIFAESPAQNQPPTISQPAPAAGTAYTDNTTQKSSGLFGITLSNDQIALAKKYRLSFGIGLFILIPLLLTIKALKLKTMSYEVTIDRIEYSRGILDRKIDNLDMFRIIDLNLRKSLLDCITGVGNVTLTTTDTSDPKFTFEKVRRPRILYDVIKKASLEADRKTSVVHVE